MERLSRSAMVDAMRRGAFYSSMGPRFDYIRVTEDYRLEAGFSSVVEVRVISGVGARAKVERGSDLTGVEYEINGNEGAVRLEIEDGAGRFAWTNPMAVF